MDRTVVQDFSPLLRIYSDGQVERLSGTATLPPSLDRTSNVVSKDIQLVSDKPTFSVRLYIPNSTIHGSKKLPLLIYFHGGAFCLETVASPTYHNYLNSLVSEADVIAVSVDYRRAPEHPLPTAYDDSWTAITWVSSHSNGGGSEEWLNLYADMERVFFAGDSAGANIAHHMGIRFGEENELSCNSHTSVMKLLGVVLVHPFFMGSNPAEAAEVVSGPENRERELLVRLWHLVNPTTTGCDDPMINPEMDPKLSRMGCIRVLVFIAEHEALRERERKYKEQLLSSGWEGVVEVLETQDEGHNFHLLNPTAHNARALMQHLVAFISQH